jgi:hypothetical protein
MPQHPHVHPREHPTKACLCEHTSHFPLANPSGPGKAPEPQVMTGHAYGVDFRAVHIAFVRTPWGTFAACPACVQGCLAEYEVVPSVLA